MDLTKDDVIQLIYCSEDNDLAKKVLSIYVSQQKQRWNVECYDRQAELASQLLCNEKGE